MPAHQTTSIALALSLALLAGCGATGGGDQEITLDASSASALVVQHAGGDITVTEGAGSDAVISWSLVGDISAADFEVVATTSSETVNVAVTISNSDATGSVALDVAVPAGMDFELQATAGDVDLDADIGPDAQVSVQASSGDIALTAQADLSAEIAVTATGEVSFPGYTFDGTNVAGIAAGTIGAGEADISLTASAGSVSISAR